MGRYLIIDTHKAHDYQPTNKKMIEGMLEFFKDEGVVLSEEETLEKFKEVWEDGYKSGAYDAKDDTNIETYWWHEIKNTL